MKSGTKTGYIIPSVPGSISSALHKEKNVCMHVYFYTSTLILLFAFYTNKNHRRPSTHPT